MKVTSILVAFTILVLLCSYSGGRIATTSSNNPKPEPKTSMQMTSPGGPVSWAPFRYSFTAIEEEALLIGISVDCPSKTPTGNEFELLPPTPSFVFPISSMRRYCRSEGVGNTAGECSSWERWKIPDKAQSHSMLRISR